MGTDAQLASVGVVRGRCPGIVRWEEIFWSEGGNFHPEMSREMSGNCVGNKANVRGFVWGWILCRGGNFSREKCPWMSEPDIPSHHMCSGFDLSH